MAGIQLGGLASGMDTESVIAQLMQLEAQPGARWAQQKKVSEARESALDRPRTSRSVTAGAELLGEPGHDASFFLGEVSCCVTPLKHPGGTLAIDS